ncbi:FtsX-like permease family protein [Streptomyces sp. E11-3]|uniref:FtsX-like permease family protein n=1 Tax=Streptomyces sp. E11-3 TaxID=3110112 RepID=UPI00397FF95A
MAGFILLRVRAHRLLLAAALLAVLLTTTVLATLTAFSGSIGDAALRHSLATRAAAPAALLVKAPVEPDQREAAEEAVAKGARRTFDGLPVTLSTLERSGPYALPRTLQAPAARAGQPDLTHLAALDRSRVTLVSGAWPKPGSATGDQPVEVALPQAAADQLKLRPGDKPVTLTDRLRGPKLTVRVAGVYRPADPADPYWQLDELGGLGARTLSFTTYGPLLADPAALASGRVSYASTSWLAAADFRDLGAGSIGALRDTAERGPGQLAKDPALGGRATVTTSLPDVLDRAERALLVSRSTLLIVALQLGLLAGYALLLVSRLLATERADETSLLRARGGSRSRIAALAAAESLLIALPAALLAPLLAGPLTRLLGGQGALARIGLRLDPSVGLSVWLVALLVALGCAAAVVAPALAATGPGATPRASVRGRALPAPLRAGADVGLLVIAGVAYWQLDRQTSGSGVLSGDREGELGIDPLLVAAPALALLAGTVLTLRLLPPVARLGERRAAKGRGLPAALAGWQLSRRPLRGAGPVLLLVLAVAMGMLAIGQGGSWDRSQQDQADFRAGTEVRVLRTRTPVPEQGGVYSAVKGVRDAAPVARAEMPLSANRTATVLAVDTHHARSGLLLRDDLGEPAALTRAVAPKKTVASGVALPKDTRRLDLDVRLAPMGKGPRPDAVRATLTAVVADRYGITHQLPLGQPPVDGKQRTLPLDLAAAKLAGPYTLTGLDLNVPQSSRPKERQRLTVDQVRAVGSGEARPVAPADGLAWEASSRSRYVRTGDDEGPYETLKPRAEGGRFLVVTYLSGVELADEPEEMRRQVRVAAKPSRTPPLTAVATERFLESSGAKVGQKVEVPLGGETYKVTLAKSVPQLPTTGFGGGSDGASTVTDTEADTDGGGLLLDLRAVNAAAWQRGTSVPPTEWWLTTAPDQAARVAAELRARPDTDPSQVLVRSEIAAELRDDPLGAGPQSALLALAVVAAALAAVGFAVSAAGSLRERAAEFAVLRALGTPRRQLARLIAAEQGLLIGLALLVGLGLGAVLARAVVPLIVLTAQATQPVPPVLVELPVGRVATLLAGVAALPLLIVAAIALRRVDPTVSLRHEGGH